MGDRFDDEVAAMLAHPDMTYSMAEKVKGYPDWARRQLIATAHQRAQRIRKDVTNRAAVVVTNLDAARDRYKKIEADLEAGTLSALDAVAAMNEARSLVGVEERRYDAIRTSEARADALHEDPVAGVEELYEKYPAIADLRLTLDDYLATRSTPTNSGGLPAFRPPHTT